MARFEARSLDDAALRAYMTSQGYPESAFPIKQWGLRELTLAAFFYHPQLEVARAQWRAATAGTMTAGQRPNPTISTNTEKHSKHDNGVSPWTYGIGFDIPLETANKRQLRIDRATALSEAARIEIGQQAWQVRNQLRISLLNYQLSSRQVSLLQREVALRAEIVQMLQNRLDAGMVSDIDLGNARLLLQKSQQILDAELGRQPELHAAVAAAVGLPATALDPSLLDSGEFTRSIAADQLPAADVRRAALLNRLDIRSAMMRYEAAEAKLRLEIAKQYPDIKLSPGYTYDQGDKFSSLGLSLLLGLLNRNEGPIAEAAAQRELESRQFEALQQRVIADQEQALARYRASLEETLKAEKTLAAQQQRTAQSTRLFDAGFSDRLELTVTKLEAVSAEQGLANAAARAQRALAALEDAVQQPLDGTPLPPPPEQAPSEQTVEAAEEQQP